MQSYTNETLIDVLAIAGVMSFVAQSDISPELSMEIVNAVQQKYGKNFHCTAEPNEIVAAFLRHLVETTGA